MLTSSTDLDHLIREFEDCTISHESWTHAAHVSVAACYANRFGNDALRRMRDGILRLNQVHGVEQNLTGGYHETMTVVWMCLVQRALASTDVLLPEWQRVNAVVASLTDKKIVLQYYSKEAIMSPAARFGWLEPDLEPLPL